MHVFVRESVRQAVSPFLGSLDKKTIRNVMIVVPLCMKSCHVSENWNNGSVTIHMRIIVDRARILSRGLKWIRVSVLI